MDQNPTASSSARTSGSPGNPIGAEPQAMLGDASEAARALSQNAKDVAQELAGRVRRVAEKQMMGAKERAADRIAGVADAVRQAADRLHAEDEQELTGYVDQAADQLGAASGYLQSRSWQELMQDAEQFARKNPIIVLGGAFLCGLLGARFLKSSGAMREESKTGASSSSSNRNASSNSNVSSSKSTGSYPIRDEDMKPFQPNDTIDESSRPFSGDIDPKRGIV